MMDLRAATITLLLAAAAPGSAQNQPQANEGIGSKACAACHADIYRKYLKTGMARSSGRTGTGGFQESFENGAFGRVELGAEVRVSSGPEGYRMEFSRPAAGIEVRQTLEWYVGSGSVGRSYLFTRDNYLFQAPVSYYSSASKWDLSPGYRTLDMTRGVETGCLRCHASRLRHIRGTENRFEPAPFLEGGIGCERCHGPGAKHAAGDTGAIVNPAKLEAPRRDSVCAQCHLTGAARIARQGRERGGYQPGELLSDYVAVYVWAGDRAAEVTATSHYEKLAGSACRKASGERLWCGSCHDPHEQPAPAARVAYYRERCLACHEQTPCAEAPAARRANGDDCTACHMPKTGTPTMDHVAFTEHGIPRRPGRAPEAVAPGELAPFFAGASDDRDTALAYAVVAAGHPSLRPRALALLEQAAERAPDDVPVLAQLAQFYDRTGSEEKALALCERIVAADPAHTAAAVNLGIYRIKRGRAEEAIRLWRGALERNPGMTGVRMNLAVALFRTGDTKAAEAALLQALEFDPASETARKLLAEVRAAAGR